MNAPTALSIKLYLRLNPDLAAGYNLPGLTPALIAEGTGLGIAAVRAECNYLAVLGHLDKRQHPRDSRSWCYFLKER